MRLAKQPRLFGLRLSKKTPPRRLRLGKFASVRRFFSAVGVYPGVAIGHQPAAQVLALQVHGADRSAVIVMRTGRDAHALSQHPTFKRSLRLRAASLTNLRRVNALNAYLERFVVRADLHPHRVTIDHIGHHA